MWHAVSLVESSAGWWWQMSDERDFEKLRRLAYKLRCIGYFFETQDPNHVCPIDIDEVQYGISIILNEITSEIITIAEGMGKPAE
jgi:hypothetical protein